MYGQYKIQPDGTAFIDGAAFGANDVMWTAIDLFLGIMFVATDRRRLKRELRKAGIPR